MSSRRSSPVSALWVVIPGVDQIRVGTNGRVIIRIQDRPIGSNGPDVIGVASPHASSRKGAARLRSPDPPVPL